jgi:acetyl esterase/lipase
MRAFGLLVSLWVFTLSAVAAETKPCEVTLTKDVTFSVIGEEKMRFDFAAPKTGGPYPCIVGLHGGAWKGGSRKDLSLPSLWVDVGIKDRSFIEEAASRGFVAVSVSYRLAPQHKFPAQIHDVKAAIRYLRAHAKELNLDPDRIGIVGFSAGGHLAALVGTTDKDAGFDVGECLEYSSRVKCVVDFFGPADLSLYAETPGIEKAFMRPLLGASYEEKPEVFRKASPVEYVTKDDPPFLIFHGTADVVVPMVHSLRLQAKLKDAGVKHELIPMKGRGHGWFGEDAKESNERLLKFFAEQL